MKKIFFTQHHTLVNGIFFCVCVSKGFKTDNQVSEKPQIDSLSSVEQQGVLSSNYSGCSHL